MENNKNKKSVKFQGDMLNFCDFIQVFVFTRNHHLKIVGKLLYLIVETVDYDLYVSSLEHNTQTVEYNYIIFISQRHWVII